MSNYHYVACDLGAESGRVILGHLNEGALTLEEIHRFPNGPVRVLGSLRWDVLKILDECADEGYTADADTTLSLSGHAHRAKL
jgi:sugar (pentulose or hexulose) kinase